MNECVIDVHIGGKLVFSFPVPVDEKAVLCPQDRDRCRLYCDPVKDRPECVEVSCSCD